jgi:hypothetical protein
MEGELVCADLVLGAIVPDAFNFLLSRRYADMMCSKKSKYNGADSTPRLERT